MNRLIRIALILILFPAFLSAVGGWFAGPMFLHPMKRALTADLIREADESFKHTHGRREDFVVRAPDGAVLRGWKVHAENPNGSWVCCFTAFPTIASGSSANRNFFCKMATTS